MAKKKIATPAKMWKLFAEYKAHVKANPVRVEDYVGKDADRVMREKEAPLTLVGFENFVANKPGMPYSLDQYFSNQDGIYIEFMGICSRIRKEIREDQIRGGMVGIYNPSITQRLNGLVDKTESKFDIDVKQITGVVVK